MLITLWSSGHSLLCADQATCRQRKFLISGHLLHKYRVYKNCLVIKQRLDMCNARSWGQVQGRQHCRLWQSPNHKMTTVSFSLKTIDAVTSSCHLHSLMVQHSRQQALRSPKEVFTWTQRPLIQTSLRGPSDVTDASMPPRHPTAPAGLPECPPDLKTIIFVNKSTRIRITYLNCDLKLPPKIVTKAAARRLCFPRDLHQIRITNISLNSTTKVYKVQDLIFYHNTRIFKYAKK